MRTMTGYCSATVIAELVIRLTELENLGVRGMETVPIQTRVKLCRLEREGEALKAVVVVSAAAFERFSRYNATSGEGDEDFPMPGDDEPAFSFEDDQAAAAAAILNFKERVLGALREFCAEIEDVSIHHEAVSVGVTDTRDI